MRLHQDWRRIARRAWSVRLIAIASVLSGVEVAVPYLDGLVPFPRGAFAALAFGVTVAAGIARLIVQRSMLDAD